MKKLITYLILLCSTATFAQQESMISFYQNHLNIVNPAFTGVKGETVLNLGVRKQWSGVAEAPETQVLSFMTSLNDKVSLGLSVVNDKVFIEKQTFASIDFSYKLQLNETHNLFMGLKAGGNNYQVNALGLQTYNVMQDASLQNISRFNPNVGIGFYLQHNDYFVSLSTPRMLNTERAKNEDGFATVATDRVHYYLSGGYNYVLNSDFTLKPTFMLRYVNGAPVSSDITANINYKEKAQLGLNYRTDSTVGALAQFNLSDGFAIGYAYEYNTNSDLLGRANGTNEFYMQIRF